MAEARSDLTAWLARWAGKYPRLTVWVEENLEETLSFYRLPRQHHKHLKSTNMLERLNEEIRRRTYVVRIFPNSDACRRLVRALGGFRGEVQPRRQHWFLNEKSGFPFRTPAFCSVSRGRRRLGEKEYRAPSVTLGVALRPRTQGELSDAMTRHWRLCLGEVDRR